MIFGSVTVLGIISWWFTPEEKWLRREQGIQAFESANVGTSAAPVEDADVNKTK